MATFKKSEDIPGQIAPGPTSNFYLVSRSDGQLVQVFCPTDQYGNAGFSPALAVRTFVSGTIEYVCEALPGTPAATAAWRVRKVDTTSGTIITWASGSGNFDKAATNLATVSAYAYS